jgi:alanine racemase
MRAGNARFAADTDWVIAAGRLQRKALTVHVANSYATLNVPESRLDMVRTGGALFGDTDPAFRQFQRIMTFKSRVATVNHYPAGSTVAYDRTYKLARDSWLANIPVGYSDGYRRTLSHANQPEADQTQAYVLVRGRRLPVVGRVTMNTVMADATELRDEIRIDDEVVLFGRQGDEEITQDSLEGVARTIGPDLYTVWGNSLPKVLKPAHG